MGFFRDDFLVLTPETFAAEVLGHPGPVFVLFCQGWDKPSKMQIAELEYLQQNHPGLKICKVDGGDYPELLQQFRVLMMPTTVCFAAGRACAAPRACARKRLWNCSCRRITWKIRPRPYRK